MAFPYRVGFGLRRPEVFTTAAESGAILAPFPYILTHARTHPIWSVFSAKMRVLARYLSKLMY